MCQRADVTVSSQTYNNYCIIVGGSYRQEEQISAHYIKLQLQCYCMLFMGLEQLYGMVARYNFYLIKTANGTTCGFSFLDWLDLLITLMPFLSAVL